MMKLKQFVETYLKKIIASILVIAILLCSITLLGKIFTDPQTYNKTVQSIDEKKATVLGVSAAIAGTATILAAVPDDSTTPLAQEMMDLSTYLALVVCILVLEKSLLTVLGATSCYILLPISCLLTLGFIIKKNHALLSWAIKICIFAIALLILVPGSMKLSDYIYEINQTTEEAVSEEIVQSTEPEEEIAWYLKLWNTVTETIKNTAEAAIESGQEALNRFIDSVSVFVIAYCAIPILTVLLFLGLVKYLFGLNITINYKALSPEKLREKRKKLMPKNKEEHLSLDI
ncbi:MAG: hypothetical protein E7481_10230 [Ruminococcaceae bacterium]|nr:hypothetical protein [Oscillospiraceae bacterium]